MQERPDRKDCIDEPKPMPDDASVYARHLSVVNFINAYYQIRDCMSYKPSNILIIGVGVGLEAIVLSHKLEINVATMDIDPDFNPDYVGSVHDMSMFADQQFDVVIASHVLEHLPFRYFKPALSELARVSKHTIIYLPYGGRHPELRLALSERTRDYRLVINVPPLSKRNVMGDKPELQCEAHYWECGYPHFGVSKITQIISEYFVLDKMYHNLDWKYSLNFLLTSRAVTDWKPGQNADLASSYEFYADVKDCAPARDRVEEATR